jgi:glycosyltransferase involved in cell wall biosynthesis
MTPPLRRARVLLLAACGPEALARALRELEALYPGCERSVAVEGSRAARVAGLLPAGTVRFESPLAPFGPAGRALLAALGGPRRFDACAVATDGFGLDTLRVRLFALRLRARRFYLLPAAGSGVAGGLSRGGFALATALLAAAKVAHAAVWPDQMAILALSRLARLVPVRAAAKPAGPGRRTIIHLIHSLAWGGAQRQLVELLRGRSAGLDVRVLVVSSVERPFAAELAGTGTPVAYLDGGGARRGPLGFVARAAAAAFPTAWAALAAARFLRRRAPRGALLHCWLLETNIVGAIAARLAGLSAPLWSIRNLHSQTALNYYPARWQRAAERATAPLVLAAIANSRSVAEDYRAWLGAAAPRLVVIENGFDLGRIERPGPARREALRREHGAAAGEPVVGFVGRLAPEKDLPTFLRAFAAAARRAPGLRGIVVGDGPERSAAEALAASLGVAGRVRFLGERSDARALLPAFDVLALSSRIEGLPNVVVEAQLAGVPVVATAAGGSRDVIEEGLTGLLVPIGDAAALGAAIARLAADPALRERIAAAACERARARFAAARMIAETEALYGEAGNEARAAAASGIAPARP